MKRKRDNAADTSGGGAAPVQLPPPIAVPPPMTSSAAPTGALPPITPGTAAALALPLPLPLPGLPLLPAPDAPADADGLDPATGLPFGGAEMLQSAVVKYQLKLQPQPPRYPFVNVFFPMQVMGLQRHCTSLVI